VPLGDWLYPTDARAQRKGAVSRRWAHDLWRLNEPVTAVAT
jgi:hypothetical protein